MRVWTKSACVVLAWGSILMITAAASGMSQSARPAQANIRTASSSGTASVAAVLMMAARPVRGYTVQPGDTLSGIAARLNVRGGWVALYAANWSRMGPYPDVIRPGTVLVLPGGRAPARYTVAAGDTLSVIATALAVRGGWPALYAANRAVIGPDPGVIRPGTELTIPRAASSRPASSPSPGSLAGPRVPPVPPPAPDAQHGHQPAPAAPATGLPGWLTTVLVAAGLLAGAAFAAGLVLARRRREQQAGAAQPAAPPPALIPAAPAAAAGGRAGIIVADHDRLVVSCSQADDTVYVLRPPGQDPREILRVARLVLPEALYGDLADLLGVPASWPVHDRLPAQADQAEHRPRGRG